ncbi:hypothetical protein COCC4DRAFT_65630 [Bipolaris maydis ATCC 48331]|uniref:Uncharacterized protein n=2 Tax=Cochliobolus heterostrophus TaxID=5016 RepID=M2UZB1_COCH5|nr:uncharacterized protein COCC4DRAFT_65630 [Bipolaris maydis ATCC 48331]EMD93143.1 hypothetical protein COCHEDRAFT_1098140 [Bipolaris maydis C5]KAH7558591.1 hypothetical protein BM1_04728 [Bipolaris maydis]ENI00263.1 hypothetical protein COCC4DRAFT_65630 [Bipolaris maydis ATCC 48331]KAJ5025817.1 hypothetical protein J3E73DRAFT_190800 [Bipolaris maydis]KAJ5056347.1 hypothetical protein J3E74DRAFT_431486 [Bipolaris maydis]
MRFLLPLVSPLVLLCATTTSASSDSSSSSSTPPADEPTPVGALWTATWNDTTLAPYTQHCRSSSSYTAKIYKLNQLYPDLAEQAPQLKVFYNKQLYAGSWDGIDVHGVGRELIAMHMTDVPYKVREWLKKETLQRHFSVQDDLVFFAPGAIYPLLPLWVEDADDDQGSECEGVFEGLERYSNELGHGKVVGKVRHESLGDKEVRFTVEAMVVKAREARDEL